jgi:hypothetical protein
VNRYTIITIQCVHKVLLGMQYMKCEGIWVGVNATTSFSASIL